MHMEDEGLIALLTQHVPGDGLSGLTRRTVWKYSSGAGGPTPPVGLSWDGPGGGVGSIPAEQGRSQHRLLKPGQGGRHQVIAVSQDRSRAEQGQWLGSRC